MYFVREQMMYCSTVQDIFVSGGGEEKAVPQRAVGMEQLPGQ